jgi:hypothetical protein
MHNKLDTPFSVIADTEEAPLAYLLVWHCMHKNSHLYTQPHKRVVL